jgi:Ca2+/Na+ antiporter
MTEGTTAPETGAPAESKPYRPATTMTLWMKLLIGAGILACAIELVLRIFENKLLRDIAAGVFVNADEQAQAVTMSDARVNVADNLRVVLFLSTIVLFLFWIYRANRNARTLGAREMRYTPGWSVGWFFVPFANLVMPYKVLREIWSASSDPGNANAKPSSAIVGWLWFFWLTNYVVTYVVGAMFNNIHGIESALHVSAVAMLLDLVQIALYAAIFTLVKGIFDRQQFQSQIVAVF